MNITPIGFNSYNTQNKKASPSFGMDVSDVRSILEPYIDANIRKLSVKINKDELTCFRIIKCKFKTALDRLGKRNDQLVAKATKNSKNGSTSLVLSIGEKGSKNFYPLAVLENFNANLTESLLLIATKLDNANPETLKRLSS